LECETTVDINQEITSWLNADGNSSTSDACGTVTITNDYSALSDECGPTGTATVTFTAEDDCGNTSTQSATITVTDITDPVWDVSPSNLTLECETTVDINQEITSWLNADGNSSTSDACGTVTITNDYSALSDECGNTGSTTVTFTATDECGNTNVQTAVVEVVDNEAPVALCNDFAVQLDGGQASITTQDIDNGSNDGCGDVSLALDITTFNTEGDFTVTLTVTDECGNEDECTATVTVTDETVSLVIQCPADVTIECGESTDPANTGEPSLIGSENPVLDGFQDVSDPGCGGTRVITRTFTASDDTGDIKTCDQTITIVDNTAPEAICQDITVELDATGIAQITADQIDNGSNDVCSGSNVTLALDVTSFDCDDIGANTVMLTVTDECGNESSCTATVTVEDNMDPSIICPADITIGCDESTNASNTGFASGTDNCTLVTAITSSDLEILTGCGSTGTIERTWTSEDENGNAISCTQIISIVDQTPPTAICQDITIDLDQNTGEAEIQASDINNGSFDDCTNNEDLIFQIDQITFTQNGVYPVTLTVTDLCGNSDECTATVTVTVIPMEITCPLPITIDCGDSTDPAFTGMAEVIGGNDPTIIWVDTEGIDGCGFSGTIIRTFTAEDINGDQVSCEQTIFIEDNIPPYWNTNPINLTLECNGQNIDQRITDWLSSIGNGSVSEECGSVNIIHDYVGITGGCGSTGSAVVTFTAFDECNNSSLQTATITINDNTPPTALCRDVSIEFGGVPITVEAEQVNNGSTDYCSGANELTYSLSPNTFDAVGEYPVTLTVTDPCENSSTCTATVTISMMPIIDCPSDTTVQCGDSVSPVNTGMATINNPNATITYQDVANLTGCAGTGSISRTFTAQIPGSEDLSCTQLITIEDNTPPTAVCQDLTIALGANDIATLLPSQIDNGSSDVCSGSELSMLVDKTSFDCSNLGANIVTLSVSDECGNVGQCTAMVTVVEDIIPTITCPENINVRVDGENLSDPSGLITNSISTGCDQIRLLFNMPGATDNCGNVTVTQTGGLTSGSEFSVGTHTLEFTAEDVSGNQAVCTVNVLVQPLPTPEINATSIVCEGDDIKLDVTQYEGATYSWTGPNGFTSDLFNPEFSDLTPEDSGEYIVTITLPNGCILTTSITIEVHPSPILAANTNGLVCIEEGAALELFAEDTNNTNIVTWVWVNPAGDTVSFSPTVTFENPTINLNGTYSVKAINEFGCSDMTTVQVNLFPALGTPSFTVSDPTVCVGDDVNLIGQTYADPTVVYHWDVSPSDVNCLNFVSGDSPIVEATFLCAGEYVFTYYVTVNGCTSSVAERTVIAQPYPDLLVSSNSPLECIGENTILDLSAVDVSGATIISWVWRNSIGSVIGNTASLSLSATSAQEGTYTVTATTSHGCSGEGSVEVSVSPQPQIPSINAIDEICLGDAVTLFGSPDYQGTITYQWEAEPFNGSGLETIPNDQDITIIPTIAGTYNYYVTVIVDGCSTDRSLAFELTVAPVPAIDLSQIPTLMECIEPDTDLQLSASSVVDVVSWQWSGPQGFTSDEQNPSIETVAAENSGTYTVVAETAQGCMSTAMVDILITEGLPTIPQIMVLTACDGEDVQFSALDVVGASYSWSGPNQFSSTTKEPVLLNVTTEMSGDYYVIIEKNGCISEEYAAVQLDVVPAPEVNDDEFTVIFETEETINAISNDVLEEGREFDISIVSSTTDGSTLVNHGDGTFTYTPKTGSRENDRFVYQICYDDCKELCDFATVIIEIKYDPLDCIIATLITPNEDGMNDVLIISCVEDQTTYPNNELILFNQWGDEVFQASPYQNDWNGTYKGNDLPDGTYYYIFVSQPGAEVQKGFITIFR
ncbi:MAG: HYR domain-containing protein, partial [Bacteroidetes bacterium]|nr:HYR domain-containing protein [Bacteroidota bacterium]